MDVVDGLDEIYGPFFHMAPMSYAVYAVYILRNTGKKIKTLKALELNFLYS